MKNLTTFVAFFAFNFLFINSVSAQIKGLFEREDPVFNVSVYPTEREGSVMLVYHFTHSKISEMNISVWLRDQGTGLSGKGANQLIRGLRSIGNRQQDTVFIDGLQHQHFYSFGIDYKQETLVSAKFESKVLQDSYRYVYQPSKKDYNQSTDKPFEKEDLFTKSNTKNKAQPQQPQTTTPCNNPNIFVQMEPGGYCGNEDRPAVLIQCSNCQDQNWDFSVELMNSNQNSGWSSLRTDGKMQAAAGNAIRTEPLCTVAPGVYYARVIALGKNCMMPVIHNISNPIVIKNISPSRDFTEKSATPRTPYPVETYEQSPNNRNRPDTCVVAARANLQGSMLRGTVELAANSPCASLNPYTEVHYIHPGYRDITTNQIPLRAGAIAPFEIKLDDRDLNRKIHTIHVVTYIQPDYNTAPVAVSAFWIRANASEMMSAGGARNAGAIDTEYYESSLSQDIETINVTASDPNCTAIQDLSLVYLSGQSDKPLYMSWINPRCCQSQGCNYSVWVGETPDRLRILVEGSKRGAIIKEILQDMLPSDRYIELVVNTENGTRKAAYVLGEGPKYGYEEIMAYRDRLKPQRSDELVASKEVPADAMASLDGQPDAAMVGGELTARGVTTRSASFEFVQPELAIESFVPCKYQRETMVVGNRPANVGDEIKIQYDFSDNNYRYTLYFQPDGTDSWVIAPGTTEQQRNPRFDLTATPRHNGKYVVLAKKASSNWGCLASSLEDAIELKVRE